MFRSKRVVLLTLILLSVFAVWAYADTLVAQTSTLSGTVSAQGLVLQGAVVREGQVIVAIESVAGVASAARATVDGTVVEVLVKPGDRVKSGQIVARIKPSK